MLPYFKDNNWNAGMVAGIRAVNGYLDGSMENIGNDESEDDPLEFIIIFFVISEVYWHRIVCKLA